MRVQDLIEALKKCDPNKEVFFEGNFNNNFIDTIKEIDDDIYLSDSGDHT